MINSALLQITCFLWSTKHIFLEEDLIISRHLIHLQIFNLHLIFPDNTNIRDTVYRDTATKKELPEKVAKNLIKADKI